MDLYSIKNPEFLKSMSEKELESLSHEIRNFLIENISKTGGHLASNLGVVELTVALHYVFDSPRDRIFFDVGHQSYVHKILTGRADQFPTLRHYHGLSGFQKRKESIHDVWEAGHSSTSLSAALGMAVARDLSHENFHVIPVIGDGALSSGMALEALNEIGSERKNMIIVFNDNKMSISRNVGGLTSGFSRLRSSKSYTKIKAGMKKNLRSNSFGSTVYTALKTFKDTVRNAVIDGGVFEEFNVDYIGPVDGHNLHDLIQVFSAAAEHEGPIVVHVITQKGRGYAPCESDREGKWHGVGPFDIATGRPLSSIPEGYAAYSQFIADQVEHLADENENIIAITPAMMTGSSLQKFFAKYPTRSFDCGIAEEHAATFAAGLAISGKRPFLAIYSSFLQRAYDQINHDICRMDLPVVIGIDHAGLVGDDGETHHGVFDIGILRPLPNMIIAQPKDASEARDLIRTAFSQKHPFAIRFPKGTVAVNQMREEEDIRIGTWTKHNDHPDNKVCILTYGDLVDTVLEKVRVNNLPVTVVNCRFFKPLDTSMIEELAESGMKLIVYESDMKAGGLASAILEYACDEQIQIHLKRFGIDDEYISQGSLNLLRKDIHIDLPSVLREALKEGPTA
ncbi:MAG: 1-deoxy-D-xylulose-5-phosphate synthase [Erysipelotrichaceae bacterium]|nr:1-deoxy-D-xylulose-5-phosphate synthase [Erysipelotrichaceae bacterium]